MNISTVFISAITYEFIDSGLANVLGLETLRHGTNPISWVQIHLQGGNPNFGRAQFGSRGEETEANFFYVIKDSAFQMNAKGLEEVHTINTFAEKVFCNIFWQKGTGTRIFPRFFATLSGFNFISEDRQNRSFSNLFFSCIGGAISFFFSPTIRFRFSKVDSFEDDPEFNGLAYRTQKIVEPWRIGLIGSLLSGVNSDWYSRARANPLKIATGVVQLTCAVALTTLYINIMVANPISASIGALLA